MGLGHSSVLRSLWRAISLALVISMAMPWQAAALVVPPPSAAISDSSPASPAGASPLVPILVKFKGTATLADADAATRTAGGETVRDLAQILRMSQPVDNQREQARPHITG